MHTAAEDTTVLGVPIAAGESLLLSYPSANRDEEEFDGPSRFDVGRDPTSIWPSQPRNVPPSTQSANRSPLQASSLRGGQWTSHWRRRPVEEAGRSWGPVMQ